MNAKPTHHRYLWLLLILLLASCNRAISVTPAENESAIPTAIPVALVETSTVAIPATATPTLTATQTPAKPFTSEDLRVLLANNKKMDVYSGEDGNLYIDDGMSPPNQLTHSRGVRAPILSGDGQKIVFYRGVANDNVYSINVDGKQEQEIISSQALPLLARGGDIKALTFRSGTHDLFFNTYLCEPKKDLSTFGICTVGIFVVNTDTGEIREIVAGLRGNSGHTRNFEPSPDGKYLAVAGSGHIDLYDTNGEIVYFNAINYPQTSGAEFLPFQYWLPDSSGLVAIGAVDHASNKPGTPPDRLTIWRYNMNNNQTVQINFPVAILWTSNGNFSISPDRNWLLFQGNETGDTKKDISLYLGNVSNGQAQLYPGFASPKTDVGYGSIKWSPDSKHFADPSFNDKNIGSVEDSLLLSSAGYFLRWLDANHYLYNVPTSDGKSYVSYAAELGGESVLVPTDPGKLP